MKIMKKTKIILLLAFLMILLLGATFYMFITVSKDYNWEIYSVVVQNQTDEIINNISIFCGQDIKKPNTVENVGTINDLQPKEYRKVNIPTSNRLSKASVPYNVSVVLEDFGIYEAAGYFGLETGGLAVLTISENNGVVSLNRIHEHDRLYRKISRRNNKNQSEISWY